MSDPYEIETVRRIFDNDNGGHISVGPDRDGLGCVEVWTEDKGEEVFGKVRLVMPASLARLIAKALVLAADDIDPEARS